MKEKFERCRTHTYSLQTKHGFKVGQRFVQYLKWIACIANWSPHSKRLCHWIKEEKLERWKAFVMPLEFDQPNINKCKIGIKKIVELHENQIKS